MCCNRPGDVGGVLADSEEERRFARVQPGKPDEDEPGHFRYAAAGTREADRVEDSDVDPPEGGPEAASPENRVDAFTRKISVSAVGVAFRTRKCWWGRSSPTASA